MWIDWNYPIKVGNVGFLVCRTNEYGGERCALQDRPAYTNQSHEPLLTGWCGNYNNTSTHAMGMARVVKIAQNERMLVNELKGAELTAALEELGYPELEEN